MGNGQEIGVADITQGFMSTVGPFTRSAKNAAVLGEKGKEFEGHNALRNQSGDGQGSSFYIAMALRREVSPEHKDSPEVMREDPDTHGK